MTPVERAALIAKYNDGYRAVSDALAGITDAELDAKPGPGKWSARDIVHHLADSESTSAHRLRLLLTMDQPLIQGYDQDRFAERLHYADLPIADALDAFRLARARTAPILARMTDADWQRTGTHSESGAYSTERWLQIYADHAHKHADQIRRARASR